ncbi:FlgD immunoglobulin-like domain containing protein [candidate division KSB1 bacterium]
MKIAGKLLLCLVILLWSVQAVGQTGFEKWYGFGNYDEAKSIIPVTGGGYVISGYFTEELSAAWDTETRAALIKVDESGNEVWRSTIQELERYTGADILQDVFETADGGFVATGTIQNSMWPSSEDLLIARFNSGGDTLWTRYYDWDGYDRAQTIVEAADGSLIIGGSVENLSGENDFFIFKTTATGDSVWLKRLGGDYNDKCYDIIKTADGNYIAAGYSQSLGAYSYNCWLIKFDGDGTEIWNNLYEGSAARNIRPTADGGYVIARSNGILKIDADGNEVSNVDQSTWGGDGEIRCFIEITGGGYMGTGMDNYIGPNWTLLNQQFLFVKLDASMDTVWTRIVGLLESNKGDEGFDIVETPDGGFLAVGFTAYGEGFTDMYLVKIDASGSTAIESRPGRVLKDFTLEQNYPNPFNPETRIGFTLPKAENVTLDVYNILGQKVKTLVSQMLPAGAHTVSWNGTSDVGQKLATGMYFYKMQAGAFTDMKKMLLVK